MTFKDLIMARDAAIVADEEAAKSETMAAEVFNGAVAYHQMMTEARVASHQAIHDLLVERGEYYLIDEHGTFTVYKPVDVEPGYLAVQPIPGTEPPHASAK